MRLLHFGMILAAALSAMAADTVTLRDGRVITGVYLGGDAREVSIDTDDKIQHFAVQDIATISFGGERLGETSAAPAVAAPATPAVLSTPAPPSTPGAPSGVVLPGQTRLVIRMIDGVDSERNSIGQTFAASLDQPVLINGETVIPRGADVVVKLVDDKESGKLTGKATLTLDLVSVKVKDRMVDLNTETVTEESASRGARTAKLAGGGAVLGAIIGAVAGHGPGAAIGAGSGAAAGAGVEILTKGERVRIPSETRLTFVLENPVRLY